MTLDNEGNPHPSPIPSDPPPRRPGPSSAATPASEGSANPNARAVTRAVLGALDAVTRAAVILAMLAWLRALESARATLMTHTDDASRRTVYGVTMLATDILLGNNEEGPRVGAPCAVVCAISAAWWTIGPYDIAREAGKGDRPGPGEFAEPLAFLAELGAAGEAQTAAELEFLAAVRGEGGAQTEATGVAAPTAPQAPRPSQDIEAAREGTTAPDDDTARRRVLVFALLSALAPAARPVVLPVLRVWVRFVGAAVDATPRRPFDDGAALDAQHRTARAMGAGMARAAEGALYDAMPDSPAARVCELLSVVWFCALPASITPSLCRGLAAEALADIEAWEDSPGELAP